MTSAFDRMKDAYRKEYENNPVFTLFLTILIAFFIVFVIAAIVTGGDTFYYVLNSKKSMVFSDYFESVVSSYNNPYTNYHVVYPSMVTVFYAVIGHFTMPYVNIPASASLEESFGLLRDSQMGIMSFVLITLVTFYVLHLIYIKIMKGTNLRKELMFLFLILLSYPFIYALERGNSIILALVFCFLFLLGHRSENKWIRYASYIALGIAAGIKIYPAILWLLLIRDKQYREAGICAAIVAALFLIPFIFTDGNPIMLFDNAFTYAESNLGFTNIIQITGGLLHEILGFSAGIASVVGYTILGLFTLLSFIVIVFDKEMKFWKILTLFGCNLVLGLGVGVQYQIIYMLPAMLYFLAAEREMTKNNKFYVICFAMMLVLIPGIKFAISVSTDAGDFSYYPSAVIGAIETAFVIIVAIALLHEGLGRMYRNRFDRVSDSISRAERQE